MPHALRKLVSGSVATCALAAVALCGCSSPLTANNPTTTGAVTPTGVSVTNSSSSTVVANLVLGQPPAGPPPNCTSLGTQIQTLSDPNLVFSSSTGNKVSFTMPTAATDKGYYQMAAGETITYDPQTIACPGGAGTCSPAVTFNFFFTPTNNGFSDNNGCSNATFPDATNLAEASINFGINGASGAGCANADDTDISAVNGVNAILQISTQDASGQPQNGWPAATSLAKNANLGKNANLPGVFGWAATNCNGPQANSGYPNPSASCAAPKDAPRAPGSGTCATPSGATYDPITGPDGTKYCDERSDQGTCNNQRAGNVTGGTIQITYVSTGN